MKKVFASAVLLLLVSATSAFALTGLDINPAGFGPVIKGFQLGEPTTTTDFISKTLDLLGNEWFFTYTSSNRERSIGVRLTNNGTSWELVVPPGMEEFASFSGTLADFLKLCDIYFEKYPEAIIRIERIVPAYVDARENIIIAVKSNNVGQFRYTALRFTRSDFGADHMPFDDYANALVNNYRLGTLYPIRNVGYGTGETENYQNGWKATLHNNGYLFLEICGAQGQTRFD